MTTPPEQSKQAIVAPLTPNDAGKVAAAKRPLRKRRSPWPVRIGVILAVVAAACFGTALYCLDRGARYALLETLWGMRVTTVCLFLIAALVVRTTGGTRGRDLPALAVIGLADVTANGLFAFASSRGMVSVASVLASLYPVATLFWARVILAERLRHVQAVGVALTLFGVVAIAL